MISAPRCFNFHALCHHLRDCKHPRNSSAAFGDSEATGRRATKDNSSASTSTPFVAGGFSEPDLLFPIASVCFIPCSWYPMVEEVALGAIIGAPGHSCDEEIAGIVEQPTNPPPTTMSPYLSNPLPLLDDIQTPGMFRSEDEQLVGHELIKALRKIKLSKVPLLFPSSHHESSSSFEVTVVPLKGNKSSFNQRKFKFKSMKQGYKVVRDLLIKKWTVVKKEPQFNGLIEMALLFGLIGIASLVVC
jgi:hypothetical protein